MMTKPGCDLIRQGQYGSLDLRTGSLAMVAMRPAKNMRNCRAHIMRRAFSIRKFYLLLTCCTRYQVPSTSTTHVTFLPVEINTLVQLRSDLSRPSERRETCSLFVVLCRSKTKDSQYWHTDNLFFVFDTTIKLFFSSSVVPSY